MSQKFTKKRFALRNTLYTYMCYLLDQGSGTFLSKRAIKARYFLMYFHENQQCFSNFQLYEFGQKFVGEQTFFAK